MPILKRLLLAVSMCCLVAGCAKNLLNSNSQPVSDSQFIRPKPEPEQKGLFIPNNISAYTLPLTDKEHREKTCRDYKGNSRNVNFKIRKRKTEYEVQSEKMKFFSQTPLKTHMGIKSAEIDEGTLVINLTNKDVFEEFEAPVVYVINKTYWEGQPYNAILENLFLFGMPILFQPVTEFYKVFGCIDEDVIRKEIDLTKGVKTGKTLWMNGAKKNKIQVKGFDQDYIFEVPQSTAEYSYGEVRINLGQALVDSVLNGVTKLTVICQTCELSDTDGQSEFKTLKASVELSSDFGAARVSELLKLERAESELLANQGNHQLQRPSSNNRAKAQRRIQPPKLTFISSTPNVDGSVELSGRVLSDAVISEVSINGRLLEVSLAKDKSFKVTRHLPMGEMIFRLSVVDEFNRRVDADINVERTVIQHTEQVAPLNPRNIKGKSNPYSVALIIGVESYLSLPTAQYADSDANHFYDYANQSLGVPPNKIKLLTDSKASRIELLKAMKSWMRTEVINGKSDVYIFFAGHGLASADGNKTYLLPADGDRDLLDETSILRDDLIASAKGAKTITMFLDTCYSGGTRTNEVLLTDARPIAIVPDMKALPPNVTVLAAASGAQLSSTYEAAQQGLFSYWLMKGLEGDADTNKDKKITTGELHEYVARQVGAIAQRRNRQQDPQLIGSDSRVLVNY
jgi:hypothetical protein